MAQSQQQKLPGTHMVVDKSVLDRNRKRQLMSAVEAWDKVWQSPSKNLPVMKFRNPCRTLIVVLRGGLRRIRSKSRNSILNPRPTFSCVCARTSASQKEVKEWQTIMDYLIKLLNNNADGISILEKDDRARETRVIQAGR